ncbi:PP2C family protein-serine/threonine phosphatase [Granulicella sibirica]|uniref:Serine phosphatase RsbU, regulator of sigma subunit n=1 Tax=Granulicella sibirica TaxID=2479048 RepID=A0A4V1L586_9BACT|nr:PP2C family protein-serine/threonine phosphatase [Granulicella sibirica]RXH54894.1 Serine phosphatase RsbU, regulator of sigma subunit [Granulicella sibirica]
MERDETLFAQQQVVRLQALLEASRRIHSTIALDEVIQTVLQIVVREIELTGAFFTNFAHTYGDIAPESASDVYSRFPLQDSEGVVFTELVVISPADRILTLDELDFLESLAMQASVAIANARFHERTVQWQRIQSDLDSARLVQKSLQPQVMPNIPGYRLSTRSVACYAVGGDYLDIVEMPSGETIIVVADVAGKGLASALVGTSFRSAFRAMANSGIPLVEIATRMNLLHFNEGAESRRRYVTAMFVQLDPGTDTMQVVNAGHNPPFLISGNGSEDDPARIQRIRASGTPVGMLPFSTYQLEKYSLPPGARLLLYTDGLTEVFRGEEEFGEERLLKAFQHCEAITPEDVLDTVWNTLKEFSDEPEQSDDMTAVVLLREG